MANDENGRQKMKTFLGAVAMAACAVAADAATIEQTQIYATYQIQWFGPVGQSFTAVEADIESIGFAIHPINSYLSPAPVTLAVYEGQGIGGSMLGSVTQSLPTSLSYGSFFDFDVSSFSFLAGSVYTAVLTTTTAYWGVGTEDTNDVYAGGSLILEGNPSSGDAAFRVISSPPVAPVPLPAGGALLLTALAGLGAARMRRSA